MTRRVKVLTGLEAMAAIVPAWEDMAAAAIEPNPFYEPWMLLPALELFGLGRGFRLVTVWNGERLDAVTPLERTATFKGLPLPALSSWRHRHCLLCTPLVRADGAAETLAALIEWLPKEGASLVGLQYIPAEGRFNRALADALKVAKVKPFVLDGYDRPVLRRAKDGETYIEEFISRKERQELRRRERRLQEQGKLTRVALGQGEDLGRWIDEFLRLEASGWKGKEGSAMICSEANRRFLTETFTAAYKRGRLEMVGIDLDGKPLGRCTGFIAGEGAYAFKPAYDEAFARFSPGIIAEVARIRTLHELSGVKWMDSFTDANNSVMSRLWKDRLTVQTLVFGTGKAGALAVAALPFLRWAKQQGRRALSAASRARAPAKPAQPPAASAA
ncbi:MAG TPA: GNAT family N-acetyltransferase [Burkholderiales bacterium]|nr:GNAT family N-acetyltransferase [Burkholderiales bacterium]